MADIDKVLPAAVIGLGASGVAAAIYLSRMGILPVCFESGQIGGRLNEAPLITNYPAFLGSGRELSAKFSAQLAENGIAPVKDEVVALYQNPDATFSVETSRARYLFRTVVISSGTKSTFPLIPGAEENRGLISMAPVSDAPLVKGGSALVWGSDDRALSSALHLASFASAVTLVAESRGSFSSPLLASFEKTDGAQFIAGKVVSLASDGGAVRASVARADGSHVSIGGRRIFILLGNHYQIPDTEYIRIPEIKDDQGMIAADSTGRTFIPGVFACGDVVQKSIRNLSLDAAEGAMCGILAYRFFMDLKLGGRA